MEYNQNSYVTSGLAPKVPTSSRRKINTKYVLLGILAATLVFAGVVLFLKFRSPDTGEFISPLGDKGNTGALDAQGNYTESPLTGELTPIKDNENSVDMRPLAVMINNHTDARPQSGLIYADVVYEVVAEGGITRYLAFFLKNTPVKIGPVRSTREYYLVLVKELGDAMLMHIGWSPQALIDIEEWPVRSLGRGGGTFWRDNPRNVAIEHTAYTNGVELRKIGSSLGWDGMRPFDIWKFKKDKTEYADAPAATNLTVDFWSHGDYTANWKYDYALNSYLRFIGYDAAGNPIPHVDQETNEQIKVKTVIVQFATEISIPGDEKNRLDYQLIGSGTGLVFEDGKVIKVTWSKADRDARTKFYDLNGKEMMYNRGKFWISIVPDRNVDQVIYN